MPVKAAHHCSPPPVFPPQKLSVRAYSRWADPMTQLTLSALPNLTSVEVSPDALALLPALPGVTRLQLAGCASDLSGVHMDALARLPQLAHMVHRASYAGGKEKERAPAVLRQLQQRLPNLALEEERS